MRQLLCWWYSVYLLTGWERARARACMVTGSRVRRVSARVYSTDNTDNSTSCRRSRGHPPITPSRNQPVPFIHRVSFHLFGPSAFVNNRFLPLNGFHFVGLLANRLFMLEPVSGDQNVR